MAITPLPTPPSRSAPSTFSTLADAFLGALLLFQSECNAAAEAMDLNDTSDVSTSSVAIGLGAKTFTVTAAKSFLPGMWLMIADDAAPSTNWMLGQVTSYAATTLVMNITLIGGSGTKTAWTISFSAAVRALATAAEIITGTEATKGIAPDQLALALFATIGDIPYASANLTPAKLAKGAANLKMFMNAGATAPEWAAGISATNHTYDLATASGNQTLTGAGFTPAAAIVIFGLGGHSSGIGIKSTVQAGLLIEYNAALHGVIGTAFINVSITAGNDQYCSLTFNADGGVLAWTKDGTPTGTLGFTILWLR
ncbi:MAG: hypothetical protein V2A54_05975 [Bacteroidota bacterium]